MNRRGFLKTFLVAPTMTPWLLAASKNHNMYELYLIADEPQRFITAILKELRKFHITSSKNFTLLTDHPRQKELIQILISKGWHYLPNPAQAEMVLSFSHLHHEVRPSFTLIKNGRVWDIRSQNLNALWEEMNTHHSNSSSLTTVSFAQKSSSYSPGKFALLFKDGRRVDRLPLSASMTRFYKSGSGFIRVRIKDGTVWIAESSCRHQICRFSPPISFNREKIICAPNHFLIEIQGQHLIDTVLS
jgi:hypothetical protein